MWIPPAYKPTIMVSMLLSLSTTICGSVKNQDCVLGHSQITTTPGVGSTYLGGHKDTDGGLR